MKQLSPELPSKELPPQELATRQLLSHPCASPELATSQLPPSHLTPSQLPSQQPTLRQQGSDPSPIVAAAAWHSLAWLVVANLIGVWLAILLLVPSAGGWLGEATYGRWMPVHLNLQLYGWISLPLVAWLLRLYQADRPPFDLWSRAALWMWSLALTLGAASWLSGHSSGKLFLDWTGYTRIYFPLAILFLWIVLASAHLSRSRSSAASPAANTGPGPALARWSKLAGLALLLLVPFAIYAAANPSLYPPVNPDSGGPTAASQLESVLVIVLILFILPYGLTQRKAPADRGSRTFPIRTSRIQISWIRTCWIVFVIEALLCLALGRQNVSHHRPTQFISLGSLLLWIPLIPAYYSSFVWEPRSRLWRRAVLVWWALLIPTGWCLFLPGVLDHLKFTDGLVSHSLMAMAGFVTSLIILLLVVILGDAGDLFNTRWAFAAWHGATLLYVAIMLYAGWIEGSDPTLTIIPSATRNGLYVIRVLCGLAMSAASINWLVRLTLILRSNSSRLRISPALLREHELDPQHEFVHQHELVQEA